MPYKSGTARWKNFVLLKWESVQGSLNVPLTSSMHKGAHVCLRVMGLERAGSRRVSLSSGNPRSEDEQVKKKLHALKCALPGSATIGPLA